VLTDEQYVSKMPHYLITLGEVCLHNPIAISNKLIQIIQCLLITPKVQGERVIVHQIIIILYWVNQNNYWR